MSADTNYAIAEAMELQGAAIVTIEQYIKNRINSARNTPPISPINKKTVRAFLDQQEHEYQRFVAAQEVLDECEYILGKSVADNPLNTIVSQYELSGSIVLPESDRMTVMSNYLRGPNIFPVVGRTISHADQSILDIEGAEVTPGADPTNRKIQVHHVFRDAIDLKLPLSIIPDGLMCFVDYIGGKLVGAHILSNRYIIDATTTISQIRGLPPYLTGWGDDAGVIPDVRIIGVISANDAALSRINDNYRRRRERSVIHLRDRIADIVRRADVCIADLSELEFLAISGVHYQPRATIMSYVSLMDNQFRTPFTHTMCGPEDASYITDLVLSGDECSLGAKLTSLRTMRGGAQLAMFRVDEFRYRHHGELSTVYRTMFVTDMDLRPDAHGGVSVILRGRFDEDHTAATGAIQDADFQITVVEPCYAKVHNLRDINGNRVVSMIGKPVGVYRYRGAYRLTSHLNEQDRIDFREFPNCPHCNENLYPSSGGYLRHNDLFQTACPGVTAARIMHLLSFDNLHVPEITYDSVLAMVKSGGVADLGDFVCGDASFYRSFFSEPAVECLRRRLLELQNACTDGFSSNGKNAWRSLIDMLSLSGMNATISDLIVEKVADELQGLGECGSDDEIQDALTMILRILSSVDELISAGVSRRRSHWLCGEVVRRKDEIIRVLEFFAPIVECEVTTFISK